MENNFTFIWQVAGAAFYPWPQWHVFPVFPLPVYLPPWIRITRCRSSGRCWCALSASRITAIEISRVSLSVASCCCLTLSLVPHPPSLPLPVSHPLHLHVIHPSFPSAQSIIKSFFMLLCEVPRESVPRSSSPSRLLLHSLTSSILSMWGLEDMCPCWEGTAIFIDNRNS